MQITSLLVAVNVAQPEGNILPSVAMAEVITQALKSLSGRNQLVEASIVAAPEETVVVATGDGVGVAEPDAVRLARESVMPETPAFVTGTNVISFPTPGTKLPVSAMLVSGFQKGLLADRNDAA